MSRAARQAATPPDRTPGASPPESGDGGLPTLAGLVGFGVLAWALAMILAVSDRAGQFSQAAAIGIVLLVGGLALLTGVAMALRSGRLVASGAPKEHEMRDPLTGLPDERYLLLRLEEETARARRYERPLTLAVLDVNSLAAVNEQYGRDSGDDVVRHVATVVQDTKRASDILVRMDDDEFAIILPECTTEGGQAFVGRVTERLARQPAGTLVNDRQSHVWVGVCAGLAATGSEEDTPASLLDRARADLAVARDQRDRRRQEWRAA